MANNKNLSNEEKDSAMLGAMNVLAKMGIKVSPETKGIMEQFLSGDLSQKEAMKIASQKAKESKEQSEQ